jgi:hypothetical protein
MKHTFKVLLVPLTVLFIFALPSTTHAQRKTEHLIIEWPAEYKWKIISRKDDSSESKTMIIPGYETTSNATLLGTIRVLKGARFDGFDMAMDYYKKGMDTGTTFTLLDSSSVTNHPWMIFKVETPITDKYPEPESDLYFVIQGEYAVYETYIAIKEPTLSKEFVDKWSAIFKTTRMIIN